MESPFFIGISGESGVGKSTVANIISLYLGNDTLRISTDDLHKWERTSLNWNKFTHLNPAANNLELGDFQIADLAAGKPIYRSVYNHTTGTFDPPTRMQAKKYVINEGLHAFFTESMQKAIDLKIFVDADEELRVHWKLIRDTEQRGYKYNSVIEAINKRKNDSIVIREKQIKSADVIIKLMTEEKIKSPGCKNEDITLKIEFEFKNTAASLNPMFDFIQKFMLDLNTFVQMSKSIGNNLDLCQNNGGNISVKVSDSIMIIKSSGFEMKDIHGLIGHSVVKHDSICKDFAKDIITDDWSLVKTVSTAVALKENKRPSMETGFHSHLAKYVVHTHPIYLNVLLCLENSKEIIEKIFAGWKYTYIDYKNPGFEICKSIINSGTDSIYFLANHGLIVSTNDYLDALNKTVEINDLAKSYLTKNESFEEFSMAFADMPIDSSFFYPDSAVFLDNDVILKREILAAHNYISRASKNFGKLRYLSKENVSFLQNLESETYRKSL